MNLNKRILSLSIIVVFLIGLMNYAIGRENTEDFYVRSITHRDIEIGLDWPKKKSQNYSQNHKNIKKVIAELESLSFVRSLVVVHKNELVIEKYFNGSKKSDSENIHSASKSILSALIGIAIEEGYIENIDQSIADYLSAIYFEGENEDKSSITLRHILTMTSGLDWTEDSSEYKIFNDDDWIRSIMSQKLVNSPGKVFNYSTGNTHLLSAILTTATGMPLKDFAERHLFNDIDVTIEYWHTDPRGYYSGGCNFFITPIEMAKFGQLYMNQGMWNTKRIVSKEWINDSFNKSIIFDDGGYGYLWWLNSVNNYNVNSAWGFAGQMIHVVPELDLVVVTTTDSDNGNSDRNGEYSFEILEKYILPTFE